MPADEIADGQCRRVDVRAPHPKDDVLDVAAWVARADTAMYAAKDQGRNRVVAAARVDATPEGATRGAAPQRLDLAI